MAANSVINTVSSFASLIGPVLGGLLYSAYGLKPVLWVCTVCFALSAVMELFIHIPFQKQAAQGSVLLTVKTDFAQSVRFIRKEKPAIGKVLLAVCGINLFLSAMIIVALPYLVTEVLDLEPSQANRLYGGRLAVGFLRNPALYGPDPVLLCYHGILYHVHRADDVLYPGGNAPEPNRKSDCCHPHCLHVRTAIGQCILWHPV